jgi:NAD(P)-dependent dehydrogenase (short-subunit alcohol dehydrogenase family)
MTDRFDGDVAVVTGAGAHTDRALGIGEATATLLAEEGARVVVADVDEAMTDRTVETIEEAGGTAVGLAVDVTDRDEVAALAEFVADEYGALDVLVNNAGIRIDAGPLPEVDGTALDRIVDVNLVGAANVMAALVPVMADSGGGSVVNVASGNAEVGREGWAPYDATKAGLLGLTRDAACDHADEGIRVNAVEPGWTITDYHLGDVDDDDASEHVDEVTTRREDGPAILRRHSHPREQAEAIAFLASDAASYITGTVLPVDGGLNAVGLHL